MIGPSKKLVAMLIHFCQTDTSGAAMYSADGQDLPYKLIVQTQNDEASVLTDQVSSARYLIFESGVDLLLAHFSQGRDGD